MIVEKKEHKTIYEISTNLWRYLHNNAFQEGNETDELRFSVNDKIYHEFYDLWMNVTTPKHLLSEWGKLANELDFVYGNTDYFILTTKEAPEDDSR